MPRKTYLAIFILAFSFASLVASKILAADTSESNEQIKQEITRVSNEIDKAVGTNDAEGLATNVSDELEYTLQTGEVITKAEWQARVRNQKINMLSIDHKISHIHVFNGDTAVLTGVSRSKVIFKGKVSTTPRKFTRTFVKSNGKWLMVAQHVTLVSENAR
jgi:hypothetical protein